MLETHQRRHKWALGAGEMNVVGADRWENPGHGGYVAKAEVAPALKICSRADIKDTDLKVFCDPEFITGGALCLRVSKWLRREA